MTADTLELASELAVLIVGRELEWTKIQSPGSLPTSKASGVPLNGSPRTFVVLKLREELHRMTARITVDTVDTSSTYTATVDGTAVNYVAGPGDGTQEILDGLAAAINADGTANQVVSAVVVDTDGDGTDDAIKLTGDTKADYTLAVSATNSGVLSKTQDSTTGDLTLLAYPDGEGGPQSWQKVPDAKWEGLDYMGFIDSFNTGGIRRLYGYVANTDGQYELWVGAAVMEEGVE